MHDNIASSDLMASKEIRFMKRCNALNVNIMREIARIGMNDSNDISQPRMVKSGSDASIDGAGSCHYFRE